MPSFFSSKKAQGMSLNVIIIAVIALLVLVVLIFIFMGKTKIFTKETTSCTSRGGTCETSCAPGYLRQSGTECEKQELICCIPFEAET
jgi:flagellar basal body-associated protein FliL